MIRRYSLSQRVSSLTFFCLKTFGKIPQRMLFPDGAGSDDLLWSYTCCLDSSPTQVSPKVRSRNRAKVQIWSEKLCPWHPKYRLHIHTSEFDVLMIINLTLLTWRQCVITMCDMCFDIELTKALIWKPVEVHKIHLPTIPKGWHKLYLW